MAEPGSKKKTGKQTGGRRKGMKTQGRTKPIPKVVALNRQNREQREKDQPRRHHW